MSRSDAIKLELENTHNTTQSDPAAPAKAQPKENRKSNNPATWMGASDGSSDLLSLKQALVPVAEQVCGFHHIKKNMKVTFSPSYRSRNRSPLPL